MRVLIQVLVGLSVLLPLGVVLQLGDPRRSESPTTAWLLSSWGWVTVAFGLLLFMAVLGFNVPTWLGAIVLLAQDAVFAWWLVVVHRVRNRRRHGR